jgi:hypothetical protein
MAQATFEQSPNTAIEIAQVLYFASKKELYLIPPGPAPGQLRVIYDEQFKGDVGSVTLCNSKLVMLDSKGSTLLLSNMIEATDPKGQVICKGELSNDLREIIEDTLTQAKCYQSSKWSKVKPSWGLISNNLYPENRVFDKTYERDIARLWNNADWETHQSLVKTRASVSEKGGRIPLFAFVAEELEIKTAGWPLSGKPLSHK